MALRAMEKNKASKEDRQQKETGEGIRKVETRKASLMRHHLKERKKPAGETWEGKFTGSEVEPHWLQEE